MPQRPKSTWFVVADAARARFLAQAAPGGGLGERPELELADPAAHLRASELGGGRPGQGTASRGGHPHRMEPPTDRHDHELELFAERVARAIDAAASRREFDRLVLVCPPRFLGRLRPRLGAAAAARLAGSLDRDLVRLPAGELAGHLEAAELMR